MISHPNVRLRVLVLCCFLCAPSVALSAAPKVAFINPAYPDEPFWSMVTSFMEAAANDLGIELTVLYAEENRLKSLSMVEELLSSDAKPDYLIFHLQVQVGARILQAAEQAKVHSFVINSNTPVSDAEKIGLPRGKFKYWLGHMFPDDESAGFRLASALITKAMREGLVDENGKVHVIGITGDRQNSVASERATGLRRFAESNQNVELHQVVHAFWDEQKARYAANALIKRYPKTTVIWSASSKMALGATQAIEALGSVPGVDLFTGGIDWTSAALEAVQTGKMTAAIGGHFMEGGWALVLLHDHYHGYDFLDTVGATSRTEMSVIGAVNAASFLEDRDVDKWASIDFKAYSLKHQTPKSAHQFTLRSLDVQSTEMTDDERAAVMQGGAKEKAEASAKVESKRLKTTE